MKVLFPDHCVFLRRWKDPFRMIVSSGRKAKKGKTAGPWELFEIKWGQAHNMW